MNNNYLSTEWFSQWSKRNCLSAAELEEKRNAANKDVADFFAKANLDERVPETENIMVKKTDPVFKSELGFVYTMAACGKKYAATEDIQVIYAKPVDENGDVTFQFTISNVALILKHKEEDELRKEELKKQKKDG